MLEYVFVGILAITLFLFYIFKNRPHIVEKMILRVLPEESKKNQHKHYIERFREHKQDTMGMNLIVQVLPWLGVLLLFFILSNQYFVFATVLSGSMEPTFKKGDLVFMQTFDTKVKVGDIVMFPMFGFKEPITHRVIGTDENGNVITKGDANSATDGSGFPPDRVIGKAIVMGGKPIVLKGWGYYIRPQNIGEQQVLTKLPQSYVLAEAFEQFRLLQPLIIFFATIFYLFILLETRMEYNRRFDNKRKNGGNGRGKGSKIP